MGKKNDNSTDKRLIFKTLILTLSLLSLNLVWYTLFHSDPMISFNLGIICPILYGIFYYIVKKTRRKLRSKIKSFIYIPIMYTLFGIIWLFFSLGIAKVTHRSDNLQPSETVIEKLEFKYFFLFNYNLSYISRLPNLIETNSWKNTNYKTQTLMKSKYQTNNLILFLILFVIQGGIIYLSENIIYPYFRPEHQRPSKRRSRRKRPPRDTFISNERDMFLNFGDNKKTEIKNNDKYPEL